MAPGNESNDTTNGSNTTTNEECLDDGKRKQLLEMKQPNKVRRRYRGRSQQCRHRDPPLKRKNQHFLVDDSSMAFLDSERKQRELQAQAYAGSRTQDSRSVIDLLVERESESSFSRFQWQRRMLFENVSESAKLKLNKSSQPSTSSGQACRSWIEQEIPFTALETDISVAILALEGNGGSYAIGLTQTPSPDSRRHDMENHPRLQVMPPTLAVHLYGLPSCNSFAQKRRFDVRKHHYNRRGSSRTSVAPKLMTIPLTYEDDDELHFSWMGRSTSNGRHSDSVPRQRIQAPSLDPEPFEFEHLYGQQMNKCVDFCISSDWRVGLAIVWTLRNLRSMNMRKTKDAPTTTTRMASLVLFSLIKARYSNYFDHAIDLGREQRDTSVFRAMQVSVSTTFGIKRGGCNLLWKAAQVPSNAHKSNIWKIDQICEVPAYLLLIDDAEGYRMVWIAESEWSINYRSVQEDESIDPAQLFLGHDTPGGNLRWRGPARPVLIPISTAEPPYWNERVCHVQNGVTWDSTEYEDNDMEPHGPRISKPVRRRGHIRITEECQLLVLSLLSDILERRPSLRKAASTVPSRQPFHLNIPDYAYELVSTCCKGRVVKLVLGFPTAATTTTRKNENTGLLAHQGKDKNCLDRYVAVLLALDIWTQQYCEIQWVKVSRGTGSSSDGINSPSLSTRIQNLAFEFRTKEIFGTCQTEQSGEVHQVKPHDEESDMDTLACNRRQSFVSLESRDGASHNSLYPDCDAFSNRNVLRGLPVMSISCRAPVRLIYG